MCYDCIGEKLYECEYCDKVFNNFSFLRFYVLLYLEERFYICDYEVCGKVFNNLGLLR